MGWRHLVLTLVLGTSLGACLAPAHTLEVDAQSLAAALMSGPQDAFEQGRIAMAFADLSSENVAAQERNYALAQRALNLAKRGGEVTVEDVLPFVGGQTVAPQAAPGPLASAVGRLAARYGTEVPLIDLGPYAALPTPVSTALAQWIEAFLAYDESARRGPNQDPSFASARIHLLIAADDLRVELQQTVFVPPPAFRLSPVLAVDLGSGSNVYLEDYALQLDAGGHDRYENHAGGACVEMPAAALFDFGGHDTYGRANTSLLACGANGGANSGSGLLVDFGGNDRYVGGTAVNGGATFGGSGLLVDLGGNDDYVGSSITNGGATIGGSTVFFEAGGNDSYFGGDTCNGAAVLGATATFVELGGNDTYRCFLGHGNGVAVAGSALLVDTGGNDHYFPGSFGNGFASGGVALLVDGGGNDEYNGTLESINGGSLAAGTGQLFDLGGDDEYVAPLGPSNGGGNLRGLGVLIDTGGDDRYSADTFTSNGAGAGAGIGILLDWRGDDGYVADTDAVNGAGRDLGIGLLLDMAGHDEYQDNDGGTGTDKTVAPKGTFGAQIDL